MAGLKAVIKKSETNKQGKCKLYIRVSHKRKVRYIPTEFHVFPNQIDDDSGTINRNHPSASHINIKLRAKMNGYDLALIKLGDKINQININELVGYLKLGDNTGNLDFMKYYKNYIDSLAATKNNAYPESHKSTYINLEKFIALGQGKLCFEDINFAFLTRWEQYLQTTGKKTNSIAVYMRNVRIIFNHAMDNGMLSYDLYPFRKYKIKHEKTAKRDIEIVTLKKIYAYKPPNKQQEMAKDLFFLSFFLIGVNFKDLLEAKKSGISDGRFFYVRAKTKKPCSVKLHKPALGLLKKYEGENNMLFKIMENKLRESSHKERATPLYKDIVSNTNKQLKKITRELGLDISLSTYFARHTWATIAYNYCGAPQDLVALALTHANNTVTDIYINKNLEAVDQLNLKVIALLLDG